MKLVTFATSDGRERIGAVAADLTHIVDLAAAAEAQTGAPALTLGRMLDLIDAGEAGLDAARAAEDWATQSGDATLPLAETRLLAPVPVPRQMRDCLAFETHYRQAREQALKLRASTFPDPEAAAVELRRSGDFDIPDIWYEQPVYYKGNRFSVIGPEADIVWPNYADFLDYELEYGVVIGRRTKNARREDAAASIFGYTIFNDMSARDAQYKEYPARLGPAKGKDFDTGNVMGPWLVTADEMTDPYALTMLARVNGEEWSRGYSGDIYHRFEDMIVHISREETLMPGEFIGSGTVGNGCGLELGRRIQGGDVIELEVEGLGVLRNRLVRPGTAAP